MPDALETTLLLRETAGGSHAARDELTGRIYEQLRAIAGRHMQGERTDHTLQPTALAHEAYLRLVDGAKIDWQGEAHFLAIASNVIRRILIDHARTKKTLKRGGGNQRVPLAPELLHTDALDFDLLDLDAVLEELNRLKPRHHRVVELRFFGGLTVEQIAHVLDVSPDTVKTDWAAARAWLQNRLRRVADSRNQPSDSSTDHA